MNSSASVAVTVVELTVAPDTNVAVALAALVETAETTPSAVLTRVAAAKIDAVAVTFEDPAAVNPPIASNPDDADTVADPKTILTPEDVTDADGDATIGSTSTPNALEPKLLAPYEYALASIIAIY
jgi:hypothetical protein